MILGTFYAGLGTYLDYWALSGITMGVYIISALSAGTYCGYYNGMRTLIR